MTRQAIWHTPNARTAGVLLCVLCLMLLAGCAGTPRISSPERLDIPPQVSIEGVPFFGQRDYQCGPAALAMVLNDSGVEIGVDALIPKLFLPNRQGSVQPEMLATVRRQGRVPFVLDNDIEALLQTLAADHPVVVMQNLSLPIAPLWHYAVATGYDLDKETIRLHTGFKPHQDMALSTFDATWARSDRWAMVALPPGEIPPGISAEAALTAIGDAERVQGAEALRPSWEALTQRFPGLAMGWFGLGNARYSSGDRAGAANAFRFATLHDPELAAAWLNLGLTLHAQGQEQDARAALEQAARLPGKWQDTANARLDALFPKEAR
ncbi:PA2778 family cysteine peptidase [Halomonas sp. YLGW01]|uniref:PA2778 family cysteine peptidase n=1 Tax=Halomonas sp. YLGW01 TaxID=2773308 RepID=UPI00178222C0|nr:PA2778 family cysteine peptidase [Halomonas sp. YLGW01]